MSQWLKLTSLIVFLFCLGVGRTGLALGPIDGNNLPPTDLERVKVGAPAPDFTLEDEKGAPIALSQFRGKKNVVLVFYRGHW
jgi:cytochrome oxidase Cu insertion factor (SCO1/SenC/PrrC family)